MSIKKRMIILGGGTFSNIAPHLALAAPAFGGTAKALYEEAKAMFPELHVELKLTKMADSTSPLVTNQDVKEYIDTLVLDSTVKIVIFNVAMCDFTTDIVHHRLSSSENYTLQLYGEQEKVVARLRKHRKDIFVVAFKATYGSTKTEQISKGLNLLKKSSANLVLANDIATKANLLITPEEGVYKGTRSSLLHSLLKMAWMRSHLSFTRSTVVDGYPIHWTSPSIPANLREVVNYLVARGAYKEFNGATTGHFAAKLDSNNFLTSIRKTNFNDIAKNGMVHVRTDKEDHVIAYGAKPSVGGQSQRIIFERNPDLNCIVHFHCPLKDKPKNNIQVQSQWQYECGSHECGQNTVNGLRQHGNLKAVMLDNHGPNIVFSKDVSASEVIDFIEANFNLDLPTRGYSKVYLPLGEQNENA